MEKELAEAKKDVEQLTADLREKQLTIMKLHQVQHQGSLGLICTKVRFKLNKRF